MSDLVVSPEMTDRHQSVLPDGSDAKDEAALLQSAATVGLWTVEQYGREIGCSVDDLRRAARDSDLERSLYETHRGTGG